MKVINLRRILVIVTIGMILFSFAATNALAYSGEVQTSANKDGLYSSEPIRISFAAGTTSAVVSGTLQANSTTQYVLRAMAGQLMEVSLSAPEGARLAVTNIYGRALTSMVSSTTSFRGYLWRTGDYYIKVSSGSQALSYSVSVSIPKRVSFELGTTSATITGSLDAHQGLDYILGAGAGQLMEIDITPAKSVQLIIYGADGTVLRSGMTEGSFYRGELPSTQDYVVRVRAGDVDVDYTMKVIIPRRISFQPGAISGTVPGSVKANGSQYYVLRAMKDQSMQVEITSGTGLQLMVYGADGTVLKSGTSEGSSFNGKLPSTQDYVLVLRAGTQLVRYTLKVTIP